MAHKLSIAIFEGSDYSFWKVKMRGNLVSLCSNIWKVVETNYVLLVNGLNALDDIQAYEENEKARYGIFSALSKTELTKVISLSTTYEVRQKMKDIYEGNERAKLTKRLTAKQRYENLKMEEGEDIVSYFEKVDNTVNEIRGTMDDEDVIEKILMTILVSYNDKILVIEETYDPKKFTKEDLFGILIAFEVRKFGKDKYKSETAIKEFEGGPYDEERSNEMEANFVRKLKKGTGKYKGMLPFKRFRCGNIGHIATRCPKKRARQKLRENKGKFNKKAYYVKDDADILDDESDYEDGDYLFLVENDIPKFDISKSIANLFHARRNKKEWFIDSGCSKHMIGDKSKFKILEKYDGGSVRFGADQITQVVGIGSITFDGKHNTNNAYYVKGLHQNLFSVDRYMKMDTMLSCRTMDVKSKRSLKQLL